MSVLVIAEKPSVGQSLAAVLGVKKKQDGYIDCGNYIISWCVGHLARLADPAVYDIRYSKWRREDLPILPETWKTTLAPDKQKQFDILKKLMHRADVDSLVCATDAGREGELIFRFVYDLAGCKKPFSRLWISSMEESAIRKGFAELCDGRDYDRLYNSALCRAKADWIIGLNATRLFSTLYGKTLNVGRVVTPTLAMLTERYAKIANFTKEKYHLVHLNCGGAEAVSEKIPNAEEAETMRAACEKSPAVCLSVTKERKTVSPPKLFDLTALQREANKIYGYTAKQTLDLLQSLYEKKLCTYPRTDSRFLTSDMAAHIPTLARIAAALVGADLPVNAAQVIDNSKVSDHHAVIPTVTLKNFDISKLPETERNILFLVCTRLVCAVGDKHAYDTITATLDCGGYRFTAKGKTIIAAGWQAEADYEPLPLIAEGQKFVNAAVTVTEHYTQPPKPHSEATLLSAMESAGASETDNDAERKGLGTSATRAAVIEKLVTSGFAERKGKQIIPTKDGENLIAVLPDVLTSPALTSEWENALTLIAKGEADPADFMRGIEDMARELVSTAVPAASSPFMSDREIIGRCPRCGTAVYEGRKNFYCGNRACAFVMWKNDRFFESRRKELTKKIAADLLKSGRAKAFDATILLVDTGGKYVNYRFEPREREK
ncbi:DNA topoisomerase [Clostridia bacterium]|nr:DNA topoisomerase [Clostridia bacterium]